MFQWTWFDQHNQITGGVLGHIMLITTYQKINHHSSGATYNKIIITAS